LNESSKSIRLILTPSSSDEYREMPMMNIEYISTKTAFYHLEVQEEQIDFSTLINIIYKLPELDSLKIHSLSLSSSKSLSIEKMIRRFVSNENKITKVCLENVIEIEEVYFLIKFCPCMNYLQVNSIKTMDVELFIHRILSKLNANRNHNLRLLCIGLSEANNKMINSKNFLFRYTIKWEFGKIYLQWENDYSNY
jgi:hypothetical protein